jgi:hypothetical protein
MLRISLSAIVVLVAIASSVSAQTPLRRYRPPAGPVLSPYLNLNNPDFNTLPDPYRNLVVPQQRLQRQLYDLGQTQQANMRRSEAELNQIRKSMASPTGIGSSYMNYSHYFPLRTGGNQTGGNRKY